MKFTSAFILALSTALASAAPAADRQNEPAPFYLRSYIAPGEDGHGGPLDGLYLASFYHGAGQNDIQFVKSQARGSPLRLGHDGHIWFQGSSAATGPGFGFALSSDGPETRWSRVTANKGAGSGTFESTPDNLVVNTAKKWGGWRICEFALGKNGVPQLFWDDASYGSQDSPVCKKVHLLQINCIGC